MACAQTGKIYEHAYIYTDGIIFSFRFGQNGRISSSYLAHDL